MGRFLRNSRGVALILTILIVSLIVALTVQFNRTMRTHVASAGNIGHGLKALYAAKSGVAYGLAMLQEDTPDVDTLQDDWANPDKLASIGAASQALFAGGRFELKIADESGKIPINQLVETDYLEEVFRRLLELEEFGLEKDTVDTIVDSTMDWIDGPSGDNEEDDLERFLGAEDGYYQSLEKPYHCKNGPFDTPEELLLVKGMTPEIFYGTEGRPGIGQYISVFGDDEININTADIRVLRALETGLDADGMAEHRETVDPGELQSPKWYDGFAVAVSSDGKKRLENVVKTTSQLFQITSIGHFGDMTKHIVAVVERDSDKGDFRILSWKIE
jgi:general secretion pathway protein K